MANTRHARSPIIRAHMRAYDRITAAKYRREHVAKWYNLTANIAVWLETGENRDLDAMLDSIDCIQLERAKLV